MKKEQMPVTAICNGTVIDHIPADKLFEVAALLQLECIQTPITIGNNLPSKTYGTKGVIKITDRLFSEDELNRIAIVAPHVRLNVIRDYAVVEKRSIDLPNEIIRLVRCTNAKCITNNEPMHTHFFVGDQASEGQLVLRCKYCGRKIPSHQIELL